MNRFFPAGIPGIGVAIIMVAIFVLTIGVFIVNHWLHSPMNLSEDKIMVVSPGDTLGKISYQLAREKILRYPGLLITYATVTGQTLIEVGEYRIAPHLSPHQLLRQLQSGQVISYRVTLVEGLTFTDFLATLSSENKLIQQLQGKSFAAIKEQLKLNIDHPEGWFYPDTYQYTGGNSDADILLIAHKKMQNILAGEWQKRSDNLPYKNPYEALIMASIIEKETGVASERQDIAGVFLRRLQKNMRLQTDPTIIYGLGNEYRGNIQKKHLKKATPYNTYIIRGLPPTPIAMPGRAAIHAALHPAAGNTLYFVAKGDGTHQFSETLAEHNQAVKKYQLKKPNKNYRSSSPGD